MYYRQQHEDVNLDLTLPAHIRSFLVCGLFVISSFLFFAIALSSVSLRLIRLEYCFLDLEPLCCCHMATSKITKIPDSKDNWKVHYQTLKHIKRKKNKCHIPASTLLKGDVENLQLAVRLQAFTSVFFPSV